jgi:AraC family transcriptional regulator, regulatory protein of adaptative response / methylated-DNA-[protein]-cysteine methyltransferase
VGAPGSITPVVARTPTAARAQRGAAGETIHYTFAETSLGRLAVATTESGVRFVALGEDDEGLGEEVAARFPRASMVPTDDKARAWAQAVAAMVEHPRRADNADIPLDVRGTVFQHEVWAALRQVQAGETVTYSRLAAAIGRPAATRAVAAACAANPTAVIVPCHRVIGADGSLTGYRWGLQRKRMLLERERAI